MKFLSKVFLVILALTSGYRSFAQTVSLSERDWYIRSSDEVAVSGEALSSGADFDGWTRVSVPSTVLGGLCEAGEYEDIFFDDNLAKVDASRFKDPWWYCTSFALDKFNPDTEQLTLIFEGINYRADVYLNGRQIMSSDKAYGAYRVLKCDITDCATWVNNLAVKITPPEVGDFYMGFVDWAPCPPDHNMGIHRPVLVKRTGKVTVDNPFVRTDLDTETLAEADLTVSAEVTNHDSCRHKAVVKAVIEDKTVKKKVKLNPGETRTVVFSPEKYRKLRFSNPRVWWPNGLGEPEMYSMDLSVSMAGKVSDHADVDFGIRSVETYMDEREVRGYKINGRPTLIKGAGFCDDMFLRNDRKRYEDEVGYVKDMNLNCLRLEGIWGTSQDLYDICDRNGILLMLGWSCQWEWPDYLGYEMEVKEEDTNIAINEGIEKYGVQMSERQEQDLADYFEDQVKWLRNHPSIFVWVVGSDGMPKASLEQKYDDILDKYDTTRSLLVSAGDFTSSLSGRTGMKMNGPYDYVAPIYWYEDKTLGGAFGFNTEVGPGPQVPLRGTIEKMIPGDKLWPYSNKSWIFHSGQKNFAELDVYNDAIDGRYGRSYGLDEYVMKAQWINYEAVKAMFEAHVVNRPDATGVIQWQLNSPWPEFYWQLYDWYLMPTGAYFGTKKGCQTYNLIYNYYDRKLYACNDGLVNMTGCKAVARLFDSQSNEIWSYDNAVDLAANTSSALVEIPALENPHGTYFLKTEIFNPDGKSIADNFYWLSGKEDDVKYEEYHWCFTPTAEYADFSELSNLPKAKVKARVNGIRNGKVMVLVTNESDKIAFCVQLVLSDKDGNYITPVKWSDNYFSLLGGESRVVIAETDHDPFRCCLTIDGVNFDKIVLKK